MTQNSTLRRFAAWLLRWCQRFSPPDMGDWAEAMLGELDFVEGDLRALAWATGGAGVLMKRSLIHFVTGRTRESAPLDSGRAGGPMRKTTVGLAILGVSVLVVLLFAPSFRQALAITTHSWGLLEGREPLSDASLRRLAAQARAERDANTLAFVALSLPPGPESDRIADEAVRLDSKLTWIYSLRASQSWLDKESPQAGEWIARVKAWDPSNAFPRYLQARRTALEDGLWRSHPGLEKLRNDRRWMDAMGDVFAATKFDSYFAARMDLDRDVMKRRHLNDPMLAVYAVSNHQVPDLWLFQQYALIALDPEASKMPVQAGSKTGEGPSTEDWKVARFGQVMSLQGQTFFERFMGAWLQREAYQRLAKLAEQAGDRDQQAMFAYQIESLDVRRHPLPDNGFLIDVYQWNAAAGQVASAAMLVSVVLLLVGMANLVLVRREKSADGIWAKGLRVSGLVGGTGLLASSIVLYISYHPYAELFSRFAQGTGGAGADALMSFWGFSEFAWGIGTILPPGPGWLALLVLAACLLVIEIYRVFASRGPAQETV
jgi:hypothetical protein